MKLVTLDILQDLANSTGVVEAENNTFQYEQFVNVLLSEYKHYNDVSLAYESVLNTWIKQHCPPIQYIDKGTSRAAFACSGGKCLKVEIWKI